MHADREQLTMTSDATFREIADNEAARSPAGDLPSGDFFLAGREILSPFALSLAFFLEIHPELGVGPV